MANGFNFNTGDFFTTGPGGTFGNILSAGAFALNPALGFLTDAIFNSMAISEANRKDEERFEELKGFLEEDIFPGLQNPFLTPSMESAIMGARPGGAALDVLQQGFPQISGVDIGQQFQLGGAGLDILGGTASALQGVRQDVGQAVSDIFGREANILAQNRLDPLALGTEILERIDFPDFTPNLEPIARGSRRAQSLASQQIGAAPQAQGARRTALEEIQGRAGEAAATERFRAQQLQGAQAQAQSQLLGTTGVAAQQINAALDQARANLAGKQIDSLTDLGTAIMPALSNLGVSAANLIDALSGRVAEGQEFNAQMAFDIVTTLAEAAGVAEQDILNSIMMMAELERMDRESLIAMGNLRLGAEGESPVPTLSPFDISGRFFTRQEHEQQQSDLDIF